MYLYFNDLLPFFADENVCASGVVKTSNDNENSHSANATTLNGVMTLNRHPRPMTVSESFSSLHCSVTVCTCIIIIQPWVNLPTFNTALKHQEKFQTSQTEKHACIKYHMYEYLLIAFS